MNYGGIGQGTPFQREKQFKKYQVQKAVENIYNHRVSHIVNADEAFIVAKEARASKKTKTKYFSAHSLMNKVCNFTMITLILIKVWH